MTVSGNSLIIKEVTEKVATQHKAISSSKEREIRLFELPFEAPSTSVTKSLDEATNTILVKIAVPEGVTIKNREEHKLGSHHEIATFAAEDVPNPTSADFEENEEESSGETSEIKSIS